MDQLCTEILCIIHLPVQQVSISPPLIWKAKNMEVKQCPGTCNDLIDSTLEFDYLLLEVIWSLRVTQRERF